MLQLDNVDVTSTTQQVMDRITQENKDSLQVTDVGSQVLYFGSKLMDDGATLSQQGITNDDSLQLQYPPGSNKAAAQPLWKAMTEKPLSRDGKSNFEFVEFFFYKRSYTGMSESVLRSRFHHDHALDGSEYCVGARFYLRKGSIRLSYRQKMFRKGIVSNKDSFRCDLGTFSASEDVQTCKTTMHKLPSGMLKRGHYKVESVLEDTTRNQYYGVEIERWNWNLEVCKK